MTPGDKALRRQAARAMRKLLAREDFALAITPYAEDLALTPGAIVGGYHAHGDEADPALLLARLVEMGCVVAFPRVIKDQPLEFHLVPDGDVLAPGSFGIPEPLAHWPRAVPHVLLVPLLAFDADSIPHETHDRTLDMVLTEQGIRRFPKSHP